MADHYRGLTQSLVHVGFLFWRQGEGRWEVWRNRRTEQEVTFDRDDVTKSRAAADAVLVAALAAKPGQAAVPGQPTKPVQPAKPAQSAAVTKPTPRKSVPSPKTASKPSGARATPRKGAKKTARRKGTR